MAAGGPSLHSLEKPAKADEILKEELRQYDCTSCRVVGGTAFIGLAGYTYMEGMKQLELNRAQIIAKKSRIGMGPRKAGLAGIALGLGWMGVYRLFG